MALTINETRTLPPAVNETYTITRPAGCVPPSTTLNTNTISFDYLDLGAMSAAPKIVSLHITPNTVSGGHCGVAFNVFGAQTITPPVFGSGVSIWTHGNGLYFDDNLGIYVEVWHINPGTAEMAGEWIDVVPAGNWIKGHSYQVDAALYADGAYTFHVQDLGYALDSAPKPNPNVMPKFFTTNALSTDPDVNVRIRAKSFGGRSNKMAVFHAGAGTGITVTPRAIFN